MGQLKQEETLYKISETESRTRSQIVEYKISKNILAIPEHWRKRSFNDFKNCNTEFKNYIDKLKKWDLLNPNIAGILSVQNGIGKTHLATCVFLKYVRDYCESAFDLLATKYAEEESEYGKLGLISDYLRDSTRRDKCDFLSEKKLALTIQDTFNKNESHITQLDILESYCDMDFLVIDDMFSTKQNEFARQNILYVIDERSDWKNKPTFITSNLSLSEIADIDTRIADRIRNSMLFQVKEKMESFRKLN